MSTTNCPLCLDVIQNESLIYISDLYRVILVKDPNYIGYIRLINTKHVKEMTDLIVEDRLEIFNSLLIIEQVIREVLAPDKVNWANLGNAVPHLHWHVIARFNQDRHFPNSIWGEQTNINYKPSTNLTNKRDVLVNTLRQRLQNKDG